MKRIFTLLSAALLVATSAIAAGPSKFKAALKDKHKPHFPKKQSAHHRVAESYTDQVVSIEIFDEKYEFTYDEEGNILSETFLFLDGTTWVKDGKTVFTYSNGKLSSIEVLYFDEADSIPEGKSEYTYENGLLTLETNFSWEGDHYAQDSKMEYTYENGLKTSETYYGWEGTEYVFSDKTDFSYDQNGQVVTEANYEWDTDENIWLKNYKYETSYNASGQETEQTRYSGKYSLDQWDQSDKNTYTYDAQGNLIEGIDYYWYDNDWNEDEKFSSTFDGEGNELTYTEFIWVNDAWRGEERYTMSYDDDGNLISEIIEEGTGNDSWELIAKYDLLYDETVSWESIAMWDDWREEFEDEFYVKSKLLSIEISLYDETNMTWEEDMTLTLTYVPFDSKVTSISDALSSDSKLYPNPTSNQTTIEFEGYEGNLELSISNLSGEILMTTDVQAGEAFSVEDLEAGVYMIQAKTSNGQVLNEKLVKQ